MVSVLVTAATVFACGPAGNRPIEAVNARQAVVAADASTLELCRLPVYPTQTDNGFLSYPGGTFTADPTGKPTLPASSQEGVTNYGYSYDSPLSRWVPVTANLVSRDGARYVYGDLHVVDVLTGTESRLAASLSNSWHPIAWEPEGIYAVPASSQPGPAGLWLVSYPAGTARQITPDGYWEGVSHGAAYGIVDSTPPSNASVPIARLDVASGAITKWFYLAGGRLPSLAGFDASGAPVIQQSVEVYLVPAALQPILMTPDTHASYAFGDIWGIWVGNSAGLFLYAGGSFTRVSDLPAWPAGACAPAATTSTAPPPSANPPRPSSNPQTYAVRPGDSLSSIARVFGLSSYLPLFWRNEYRPQPNGGVLINPNLIRPGWVLEIPTEPLTTYVVHAGDSLSSIAEHFYGPGHGGWWHGIYDANRDQLSNPALIYPGQKLRIP